MEQLRGTLRVTTRFCDNMITMQRSLMCYNGPTKFILDHRFSPLNNRYHHRQPQTSRDYCPCHTSFVCSKRSIHIYRTPSLNVNVLEQPHPHLELFDICLKPNSSYLRIGILQSLTASMTSGEASCHGYEEE